MIKELEEDREESQDPEVEFAIAGAVRECGGLEILLRMIQVSTFFFDICRLEHCCCIWKFELLSIIIIILLVVAFGIDELVSLFDNLYVNFDV